MKNRKGIEEWFNDSFVLTEGKLNNKFNAYTRKALGDYLYDKITKERNGEKVGKTNLTQVGNNLGIRPYSGNEENGSEGDYTQKGFEDEVENSFENGKLKPEISQRVKTAAMILRKYVSPNGGIKDDLMRKELGNGGVAEVMKMKDFLDRYDLRYMYDPSVDVSKKDMRYGNRRENGAVNIDDFDLNNISDQALLKMTKRRKKDPYTTKEMDQARAYRYRMMAESYARETYGLKFEVPTLESGNAKVKGALLINFTSAFRCPAWNECLVKHACYARSGEGRYPEEKNTNDRKQYIWENAQDEEFQKLIMRYLAASVVNYAEVNKKLNAILKEKGVEAFKSEYPEFADCNIKRSITPEMIIEKALQAGNGSNTVFGNLSEGLLEVLKEKRSVNNIRLNENGDFIAQWLIDFFDKVVAPDFLKIGVVTAAYVCRNLNFKNIKNIILNASRTEMKGNIERYFYALPGEMYDAFPNTYGSASDMNIPDTFDAIKKVPQPLFGPNGLPNGNVYYKCPCGRTDFKFGPLSEGKAGSINCYQCHLCYERTPEEIKPAAGGKFIVFVRAHGANAGSLYRDKEHFLKTIGVPEGYKINEPVAKAIKGKPVNEGVSDEHSAAMSNEAYSVITGNAISSMNQHLGGVLKTSNGKNIYLNENQVRALAKFLKKKTL